MSFSIVICIDNDSFAIFFGINQNSSFIHLTRKARGSEGFFVAQNRVFGPKDGLKLRVHIIAK